MTTIVKLTKEQLEAKAQFIDEYMKANNAADGSAVDANANVSSKNVATLTAEIHKDINVQLKRYMVSNYIEKMFGKELADEYNRQINAHEIYVHDESHFALPYCTSVTMYPFLFNGLKDLGGESAAPQHLASFCGGFINLVFAIASQFAGACLYHSEKLLFKQGNSVSHKTIKDLLKDYPISASFENNGTTWEYANVKDEDIYVAEDDRVVKVNKLYRRKYSDKIYEIKTKTGLVLKTSKDHKFKQRYRARDFEVKAEDLQVGDTVYISKGYRYLVDFNSDDYKRGQLLGIICGDGNIKNEKYSFVACHPDQTFIMDFLDENLHLLGITPLGTRTYDKRGSGCFNYYIGSVKTTNQIRSFFKKGCYDTFTKEISLKDKNLNWKLGFLDGLLVTDGHYSVSRSIHICLVNKNLLKMVQSILEELNIYKRITEFTPKQANKSKNYKIIIPTRFIKYCTLLSQKEIKKPKRYERKHTLNLFELKDEPYYIGPNACATAKATQFTTNSRHRFKDPIKADVITEINTFYNDDEYVYEIETESHWYNAKGFITHNCATVEWLMYFDYFARKDYGENYLETHGDLIKNCFQQVVYSINQPASARGYQSVFWNISIFDKPYFESIFGDFRFPDGEAPKYETLSKLQAFFMDWFNDERRKALLTFPVVTAAILTDGKKPVDEEFLDMCAEQDSKGNSFFKYMSDSADSLASCCRLRNALQDNTFSYSLGAGGVSTGSLNVITLNANRFIQNCVKSDKDIFVELKEQIKKIHKYQLATKAYLEDYLKADMLPIYKAGYINMKKQFLTVGINGVVDGAEFLGYKASNNSEYKEFTSKFLNTIYMTNNEGKKEFGVLFNTEFVPAENLGCKNYKWDKKDGYVVNPKRNCYNSYLYPVEDENIDIVDKFIIHGKENLQYLDGGSALHLNLEEYPNKEGYKKLYYLAAETGCNYWTTNIKVTCCEDCGNIDKRTLKACPKCGSKNITYATRIIGYLKKVSSFSSERQKEEDMRYYHKV